MLEFIESITPGPLRDSAGRARILLRGARSFWYDYRRFRDHYSKDMQVDDRRGLEARLIFHAHALEKGLSHTELRLGFGKSAISALIATMGAYVKHGFPRDSKAYRAALSALKGYQSFHRGKQVVRTPLDSAPTWVLDEIESTESDLGGAMVVDRAAVGRPDQRTFVDILHDRHSVREYRDAPVSREAVEQAIAMATRSPSVCNRQGIRVRVCEDPAMVEDVLRIQGGMNGYPKPPILIAITADVRDCLDFTERNQPFIDGGIFAMTLLLALESLDLAACPLNAMFSKSQDLEMRAALSMAPWEVPVVFISVGAFPDTVRVPKSFRYDAKELTL